MSRVYGEIFSDLCRFMIFHKTNVWYLHPTPSVILLWIMWITWWINPFSFKITTFYVENSIEVIHSILYTIVIYPLSSMFFVKYVQILKSQLVIFIFTSKKGLFTLLLK